MGLGSSDVPYKTSLDKALEQVQWGLINLCAQPSYAMTEIRLKSVDLSFVTETISTNESELEVLVVTVAGSVADKSTQTLSLSLQPPPTDVDKGIAALDERQVAETITSLGLEMLQIIGRAIHGQPPLVLSEGIISMELVVDEKGSIKVATPEDLAGILKVLGVGASAKYEVNDIKTSSITLTFEGAHRKDT